MPMFKHLAAMLTCAVALSLALELHAGQTKAEIQTQHPTIVNELNNSMEGRQFIVAIPPNGADGVSLQTIELAISVTSRFNTNVSMEIPGAGIGPIIKQVGPGRRVQFSDQDGSLSWAMEVRQSEVKTAKGIVIRSDEPIAVRVVVDKRFTSEAFMVRPTVTWGNEYRHIGYYDFPETQTKHGGGFIVTAQEDGTNVTIDLQGTRVSGFTAAGNKPGDRLSVTLNRAETYMIRGNGEDPAFDLTGTRIRADKPIGIVSFHQRTIIPIVQGQTSRDMLAEMPAPVEAAGTMHISREIKRTNKGDYFRIMALEDNTEVEVFFYDIQDNLRLIGTRQTLLSSAGDWAEYEEVRSSDGKAESIRGIAVWSSSKPTMLMQYSYSSGWDGSNDFDPFYLYIPPVEQYMPADTYVQGLTGESGLHRINLMVQLPSEDGDPIESLADVTALGRKIADLDTRFPFRRIPGTNVYSAFLEVTDQVLQFTSPYRSAVMSYGSTQFSLYGTGDLHATNFLHTGDVKAPVLTEIENPANDAALIVQALDSRPDDSGVAAIELIHAASSNAKIEYLDDLSLGGFRTNGTVRLTHLDQTQDAEFTLIARDRAGNVCTQEFTLEAVKIDVDPKDIDFGLVRVGTTAEKLIEITNPNNYIIQLENVTFSKMRVFNRASVGLPRLLEPGDSYVLDIRYQPEVESALESIPDDEDILYLDFGAGIGPEIALRGIGGIPRIESEAVEFGTTTVGEQSCEPSAIQLFNSGTFDLQVTQIPAPPAPFEYRGDAIDPPLIIAPGSSYTVGPICFVPTEPGEITRNVTIVSDAEDEQLHDITLRGNATRTTSVEGIDLEKLHVTLLPNPATDHINIRWQSTAQISNFSSAVVNIYNLPGQLMWSGTVALQNSSDVANAFAACSVDVSTLQPGSYYLTLSVNGSVQLLSTSFVKAP